MQTLTVIRNPIFHLLVISLLGLICYSNTFQASFQWDEDVMIVTNPIVKDFDYFLHPSKAKEQPEYGSFRRRYVSYLTFALNYYFHGLDVKGYHVFNVSIHILNALLVYSFVVLTLRTPYFNGSAIRENSGLIALFSGLLFVSHPVQTEAVTYIMQRFASLVAFFYLLSITLYVMWRLSTSRKSIALYLMCLLSALLAINTKENSLTLPFAIMLYEGFFFKGSKKARILPLIPLFLLLAVFPIMLADTGMPVEKLLFSQEELVVDESVSKSHFSENYVRFKSHGPVYLATQFRVIVTYMRLLLLPVNQNIDYDYPVFKSFFNPNVFLSFFFLFGIFALGVYLFRRSRISNYSLRSGKVIDPGDRDSWIHSSPVNHYSLRLVAFGIFWFFLTLSVESSILPIGNMLVEYRVYLPSVGVFIIFSSLTLALVNANTNPAIRKIVICIFILIVLVLSSATFARNSVWQTRLSLWADAMSKSPNKARPHLYLGHAYMKNDLIDEAINEYEIVLALDPYEENIHLHLGNAYLKKNLTDKAIKEYKTILTHKPNDADAHFYLGGAYIKKNLTDKAIKEYKTAITINPDSAIIHYKLGSAYQDKGMLNMAIDQYKTGLELKPGSTTIHYSLGTAYQAKGMLNMAIDQYKAGLKINPDSAEFHIKLGMIYKSRGFLEKSIEHYRQALSLSPDLPDVHYNIGNVYMRKGLTDMAIEHYRKSISLRPEDPDAHYNLSIAYRQKGLVEKAEKHFGIARKLSKQ
jgi:tetratricopeptide (TPR) repeat protein